MKRLVTNLVDDYK